MSTVLSGARVGTLCGSGWPSDGPPKPPSPRAKREATSVASFSPFSSFSTVWWRITAPLSLPLSNTSSTVESAVMWAAVANGLWKVMSRSPSTTITRLRFISPGPAPQAATDAKVGTTFSGRGVSDGFVDEGQFLLVHGIGAHADAVGVEHHFAIGIGVFLAEILQGHQLIVLDRHFVSLPNSFSSRRPSQRPLPLWERASPAPATNRLGEGLLREHCCSRIEPLIRLRFANAPSPTRGEGKNSRPA